MLFINGIPVVTMELKTPGSDPVDLSSVELSHYRLSKLRQQTLSLAKDGEGGLYGITDVGRGKSKSKEEVLLSQIIDRINEMFVDEGLSEADRASYLDTIGEKVRENDSVMQQLANNAPEAALIGDFPAAVDDAVMESGEAHQNLMMQYLNSKPLQAKFQRAVFDWLQAQAKLAG